MTDRAHVQLCSVDFMALSLGIGEQGSCRVLIIARHGVQIKKMTDRDIARLWSQYVKELAVLLVRAEGGDPPPEVIARMEELVCRELLLLYIR